MYSSYSIVSKPYSAPYCLVSLPALGQKVYIDPANYENPEAALKEFVNEICYKSLLLERVLGGGEP